METTQIQGIKNFTINLETIIGKIRDGKKLHPDELKSILEYWKEIVNYFAFNPEGINLTKQS